MYKAGALQTRIVNNAYFAEVVFMSVLNFMTIIFILS